MGGTNGGPGNVDDKEFQKKLREWGKLPEKERADAMQRAARTMPAKYQDIIEVYLKKIAQEQRDRPER